MNQDAASILKEYFGYDSFRPIQAQIIQSIFGKKDTVVLMPTGGGKSICFQIPALMLPGLCVVISPLISLMKDQVDALLANGISAAFLNSSLDFQTQNIIRQRCRNNEIKILYISPERVVKEVDYLLKNSQISLFAIDEAHCISSWGHDFRPEYTKLANLKTIFPNIPICALTATANSQTKADIINQLNLIKPNIFIASFDRPNLSIGVRVGVKPKERTHEIIKFIQSRKQEIGIIYCLSRNTCDNLSEALQANRINAASYHAGLSAEDRRQTQEKFIQDKIQVVCATIAFGMGIDKSNVRYVIHFNVPKSIEGYYQEIGRAGRDGLASDTLMYFNYADLKTLNSFANEGNQSQINLEKLKEVQDFAEAKSCRRRILLAYFGQVSQTDCGNCDICRPSETIKKLGGLYPDCKTTQTNNYSIEIFNDLRKIRLQLAEANSLPAYIVFSDATLKAMAEQLPSNKQQMLAISGVGQVKLERYGQNFLKYFQSLNLPDSSLVPRVTEPEKPKKTVIRSTYAETLSLYRLGLSAEEISRQRELSLSTIYTHFELLYQTDQITDLNTFISLEEIQQLRLMLNGLTTPPKLREIFESLGGQMEYYKIKLILAYLNKQP